MNNKEAGAELVKYCKPLMQGYRCDCPSLPEEVCTTCYGIGLIGGYDRSPFSMLLTHIEIEIIEQPDWRILRAVCPLLSVNIFHGCLFELDGDYWRVVEVTESFEEENEVIVNGWKIKAKKIMEYEPAKQFCKEWLPLKLF